MMLLNQNFLQLRPKVAMLDDDVEIIQDVLSCLQNTIQIQGFSNYTELSKRIQSAYISFLQALTACFMEIEHIPVSTKRLQNAFNILAQNIPYTVVLVDLNLQKEHDLEGFELCEQIEKLAAKSIIYTGNTCEDIAVSLINQGVISAYFNKSCDLYEDLVPAIRSLNSQFYYEHFNLTHILALKRISPVLLTQKLNGSLNFSSEEEFLIYDEALNHLHLDPATEVTP